MAVSVHHKGREIEIEVHVDVEGFLYIKAFEGDERVHQLPPMTPFEASMLARDLERAADKADIKNGLERRA